MRDLKLLLKRVNWRGVYVTCVSVALVWVSVSYYNHKCPKPHVPDSTKELVKIKTQINDANTKDDLDSLLLELYGFESK